MTRIELNGRKWTASDISEALETIRDLASWQYDEDPDPDDTSPEDMTSWVNGMIMRECDKFLGE